MEDGKENSEPKMTFDTELELIVISKMISSITEVDHKNVFTSLQALIGKKKKLKVRKIGVISVLNHLLAVIDQKTSSLLRGFIPSASIDLYLQGFSQLSIKSSTREDISKKDL